MPSLTTPICQLCDVHGSPNGRPKSPCSDWSGAQAPSEPRLLGILADVSCVHAQVRRRDQLVHLHRGLDAHADRRARPAPSAQPLARPLSESQRPPRMSGTCAAGLARCVEPPGGGWAETPAAWPIARRAGHRGPRSRVSGGNRAGPTAAVDSRLSVLTESKIL